MPIPPFKKKPAGPRPITLALQGGGSHGAFEWGVLDRLLEEELSLIHISEPTRPY